MTCWPPNVASEEDNIAIYNYRSLVDIGKFVPPKGEESLEGCGCEKIKVLQHAVNKAPSFTSKSQKSNCDVLPCTI